LWSFAPSVAAKLNSRDANDTARKFSACSHRATEAHALPMLTENAQSSDVENGRQGPVVAATLQEHKSSSLVYATPKHDATTTSPLVDAKVIDNATLRWSILALVIFSLAGYFALLGWGIGTRLPQNITQVNGLPTVSDMLAEHLPITMFCTSLCGCMHANAKTDVLMVCLYSEIRTTWNIAHLLNSKNPHMVAYLLRTTPCCGGAPVGRMLLYLTVAIRFFGLLQIATLLLIAVVPVQPPSSSDSVSNHYILAIIMTLASIVHAILLSVRRQVVYDIYVDAGKEHRVWGRAFIAGDCHIHICT